HHHRHLTELATKQLLQPLREQRIRLVRLDLELHFLDGKVHKERPPLTTLSRAGCERPCPTGIDKLRDYAIHPDRLCGGGNIRTMRRPVPGSTRALMPAETEMRLTSRFDWT